MKVFDVDVVFERVFILDGNCDKIVASSGKRLVSLYIIDVMYVIVGGFFVGFFFIMCLI